MLCLFFAAAWHVCVVPARQGGSTARFEKRHNMTNAAAQICERLSDLQQRRVRVAHDVEGFATSGVSICSFAWSATEALSIPLRHCDGTPFWPPITEQAVMQALRAILEDPAVPKIAHNWAYEIFVWAWAHGIHVRGVVDDTMLLFHELFAELEKALEVPASLFTRQPYWKDGRHATDDLALARYNVVDSCVTYELAGVMAPMLDAGQRDHYTTNVSLLAPCLWQMLKGIRYDTVARDRLVAELQYDVYELQGELDALAGIAPPTFAEVAAVVALKRKLATVVDWPDIVAAAKPLWAKGGRAKRVVEMARRAQPVAVPPA